MKKLYKFFVMLGFLLAFPSFYLFAQVGINTDNSDPDPSAGLDVKFENKGFLPPRMTFEQRNAIQNPVEGLMVFCTNCDNDGTGVISIYKGGKWRNMTWDCTVPVAPEEAIPIAGVTQITWNWNAVPIALGYKWNTVNNYVTATDMFAATNKIETGLTCQTNYTRYAWAYNDCGPSVVQIMNLSTQQIPLANSPVAGTHSATPIQVVWNWNPVAGATGYRWSSSNYFNTATNMSTAVTKTETGLTCGTAYTRYVWAYDGCGNSTATTLTQSTNLSPAVPLAGIHVPSTISIIWKWNTVSGATGYKWNTVNDYATATNMGTAVTKTETGLNCSTPYTRYVWAYNTCGYSTPVALTQSTIGSIPDAPVAGIHVPSTISIIWNWNTVPGATGYKWNTTNNYGTATDVGSVITITESGLTCNTGYTRYVWSFNTCGNSAPGILNKRTTACCGSSILVHHSSGAVAPVTKAVTYGIITGVPGETEKCWITSNLGASQQATAVSDATEASAGWYWQFNKKQGYKHDGNTRTPNTTWISSISESSDWTIDNDPCRIEMGGNWRIPTKTEWTNVDDIGGWLDWNGPWNSALKMHAAGWLEGDDGTLYGRGSSAYYYSSSQVTSSHAWSLNFSNSFSSMGTGFKVVGHSCRCLRD